MQVGCRVTSRCLAFGFLTALVAVGNVRAELLYFKNGGRTQAAAAIDGQVVRVLTPAGPFAFDRSDFRAIVPGNWPETEWPERRKQALAGSANDRFAAAWWALENGLTPEAESMLRETLAADKSHQPAGRMVAMLDRLTRPCADPNVEPLVRAVGGDPAVERGPHVILVHHLQPAEAAERVDVLERVVHTYYLIFVAKGLELRLPTRRMASLCFGDRNAYRAFLKAEHGGAFINAGGYYHPTLNTVVTFDSRTDAPLTALRQSIDARKAELADLRTAIDGMPPKSRLRMTFPSERPRTMTRMEAREALARFERDVPRMELFRELDWRSIDLGTAAHEMVHQLMATSGLYHQHDDFPTWLHEGFAGQFEVIRGGRWAGVGRAHDIRLPDWRSLKPPPRLIPLVRDEGFGHGYQRDVYAKSWALVYFLRKRHPDAFITYLDLLRNPGRSPLRADERYMAPFTTAFGSATAELERDWLEFVGSLSTPLESHEPKPSPPAPRSRPSHRD